MAEWALEALLAGCCAGAVVALARAALPRSASADLRHDGHLAVILAALFGTALGPWLPNLELPCLPLSPAASGEAAGNIGGFLWSGWLWAVYSIAAAALIGRRLTAELALLAFVRRVQPLESHEWCKLMEEERQRAGVKRRVSLGSSPGICGGVSFGVIRPVVLLAADAREGPNDRWRAVLVHELAHVRRMDALSSWAADFATALFWFLPWIWHSARCMRFERELACDEAVVARGCRPSSYASLLLTLLREHQRWLPHGRSNLPLRWNGVAAAEDIVMGLEARIASVLAPREAGVPRRRRAGGPEAREWCLAAALSVGLLCAGIRLVPEGEGESRLVSAPYASSSAVRVMPDDALPAFSDSRSTESVQEPASVSSAALSTVSAAIRPGHAESPSQGRVLAPELAPQASPSSASPTVGEGTFVPRVVSSSPPKVRFAVAAPSSPGRAADRDLAASLGVPEAAEALSSLREAAAKRRGRGAVSLVVLSGSLRLDTRDP